MGRKKSKARQKQNKSIDIQMKFPNDRSESTFNFESKPTLPSRKMNFQSDDWFPFLPNPKISSLGTNNKDFPKLPILSNSMQELGPTDAESFLTSDRKAASCDNLPLTSTLTPFPSSRELKVLEAHALNMDRCCSFALDDIIFKDSVPCIGNHLQDDMAKIVGSLHSKSALSFSSKIHDLSYKLYNAITTYNSVCKMAAVRIDMLITQESLLTEKVSRQRSQIEELENKVQELTNLISENKAWTSDSFVKQHIELDQKDKIIESLEEIKILKAGKFRGQSSKFNEKDKTVLPFEEDRSLKANTHRRICFELDEKNEEVASLETQKLDTEETCESQQNLEMDVLNKSCENLIAERKSEAETETGEFDEILELGKYLSRNLLSVQKAKEIRLLQKEAKCLKVVVDDQEISWQEVLVELNSLRSKNASLTEQLHSKKQKLQSFDTEFTSLRNDFLVKLTKVQELEKTIENLNDDLERSDGLILSLQEENKGLKQNSTQLDIEICNSKASCCLLETPRLPRCRDCTVEEQKINLHKNNETQQVLKNTQKFLTSSHFPLTEENNDEQSFEFQSDFTKNVPLNIVMRHEDNLKSNISAENSFQDDVQNLKHQIEIQQLLQQQSSYIKELAQEISSIKLQNSSLSERLSRNELKLALLTSFKSSIVEQCFQG